MRWLGQIFSIFDSVCPQNKMTQECNKSTHRVFHPCSSLEPSQHNKAPKQTSIRYLGGLKSGACGSTWRSGFQMRRDNKRCTCIVTALNRLLNFFSCYKTIWLLNFLSVGTISDVAGILLPNLICQIHCH